MPYKSNFSCPQSEDGVCASITDVHDFAVQGDRTESYDINGINEQATNEDTNLDDLFSELNRCAKNNDRKCISETRQKIESIIKTSESRGRYHERIENRYKREDQKLRSLSNQKEAPGPQRTDQTLMQIVILPYEGKSGELFGKREAWVVVDQGSWVMGDPLNIEKENTLGRTK